MPSQEVKDQMPDPPDGIPKTIARGLKRQNIESLRKIIAYCEELIEFHLDAPEPDQDDNEQIVEKEKTSATTWRIKKKVSCGDDTCHCMDGGELHGPYIYEVTYSNGNYKWDYKGKP